MEAGGLSRVSQETWSHLAGQRPQGETLWARRAAPEITERLIAGLDADNRRHFLILLSREEKGIDDRKSRGVEVATRELRVPGHETGQYLDVTCLDSAGYDVFDLIGGELADRLASGRETAPEVTARVLAKWRRFWGQLALKTLSLESQLGLFGELWFLSVWLAKPAGAATAVTRWRGPFGARHDFEWAGRSVEVKTTESSRGRIHRINGLDQLLPPENGDLLFFSLRVREEAGATNSLPILVEKCRALLTPYPDALGQFESAIVETGYSSLHADEYAKLHLRVAHEGLYWVDANFPRLTTTVLKNVPAGIERVEYEINLAGCDELLVAPNPADPKIGQILK